VAAAFEHVVLLDPPPSPAWLAIVAGAAPRAWIHALWGSSEAEFAGRVLAAEDDLDATMRRVWRALTAASRFDDALEQELLRGEVFLRSAGSTAAALRVLREAGLLRVDEAGGCNLERPQSKVDVTCTDTYRTWHTLFPTNHWLPTCLTARL
jgi:hypothetical protein